MCREEREVLFDLLKDLECVRQEEKSDYQMILRSWENRVIHTSLMPAIHWYSGIYNLFDQKAGIDGKNMIWIVPAGQADFFWLHSLERMIVDFYDNDVIPDLSSSSFPGVEAEEFEECILLHSDKLQNDPERTISGANVILIRLALSGGGETILLILLDHEDHCWNNIIENYEISLTWLVDSGRGMEDYFVGTNLYKLMIQTAFPEVLSALYFKGLYNKGEIPDGFHFLYAMLSEPKADGYDPWHYFSGVYNTGWTSHQ